MLLLTSVACMMGDFDDNRVSGADNGVDVSEYLAENGPQDMTDLGYPGMVGFPTLGARFDLAGGCYAGVNAAGTDEDWEANNVCIEDSSVTIEETGTRYGLQEFDPGNGSSGYYHGNMYNAADPTCGPSVKTWDCWYNLEDFEGRNKLIDCGIDDQGDLVCALDFYSTWDGISVD